MSDFSARHLSLQIRKVLFYMNNFKLGVILESFKLPLSQSIEAAAKIGADGVQIYANDGGFAPVSTMSAYQKSELIKMLNDKNIKVSALCADFGMGFGSKERNPMLLEKSKRAIELAKELGTNIVTTHIGVVPSDKNHPRYKIMQEACGELASYADRLGSHFAVETGPETSLTLKEFLDSLDSKGVSVNLDPANLVMVTGDDPVMAVYNLKDYIVHTHAKDGIKLGACNPEVVYRITHPADGQVTEQETFREVPLGKGSVPFKEYLTALHKIGYNGFLTIEREVGDRPDEDIELAAKFLREVEKSI